MPDRDERSGRETRLLALVIVIALAALLVLARFRFPAADLSAVTPAQGPLERLAARSTYEDLAASVANLVQRVSGAAVVFQIQPEPEPDKAATGRRGGSPEAPPPPSRLVAGARIGGDLAIVHVPAGYRVTAGQGLAAPVEVVAVDPRREIALVRAPSVFEISSALAYQYNDFAGFSYVGIVEAAVGGITAKPMFVGRADISADDRWPAPILVIGGSADIPAGALVFALDGRFIGLALPFDAGSRVVVPGPAIDAVRAVLESGRPPEADAPGARGRGGVR